MRRGRGRLWRRRLRRALGALRRPRAAGAAGSALLHLALVILILSGGMLRPPESVMKRGEPILVDLPPERPEEPAPRGNPARRQGPAEQQPERQAPAPRVTAPPPSPPSRPQAPPRVAEPPRPPEPRPAPEAARPPEPAPPPEPREVARAAPPAPGPEPAPRPAAPEAPREAQREAPAPAPAPPQGQGSDPRFALSAPRLDPPPSIFRRPGGGGGLRGGRGGVEGEPVPLDTPEPRYQDYFRKVRERILSKWIYPREAGERGIGGQLLIEFHIAKDGTLAFIELRRSSGVEVLDEYAMNAVRLAQPFPPVPDALAKQVLPINGRFVYDVADAGLVNRFLR